MKKILVVDDSIDVRENIVDLLEINGYSVFSAENGYEGFKIATAEIPDLIIADVMMPVMDGMEMLKKIRENNSTSTLPLIFLSARSAMSDLREGMGLGADDYITKPFLANDILSAVKTQLTKKRKIEQKFENIYNTLSCYIPHELRTPLVSIMGFTKIMQEDLDFMNKEELKDMLSKIENSSIRLHKTIEKFIVFSESEIICGNRNFFEHLLEKSTNVHDFILSQFLHDKMRLLGSEHPITINIKEDNVNIFEEHYNTIVSELIENAVKFSYPNKPIEIYSVDDEASYTLNIKNYGRGMTLEEINQIAPFHQHHRQFFEQSGNGLGLMTVKRLCAFYNLEFEIKSDPGNYTEVSLEFLKNKTVAIHT